MPKVRGDEWKHVDAYDQDKFGNHLLKCNYCSTSFKGSAFKIRSHLLSCKAAPAKVVTEMREKCDLRDTANKDAAAVRRNMSRIHFRNQQTIGQMMESGKRDACDDAIVKFEAGLPAPKINFPCFKSMVSALKSTPLNYVPQIQVN